jgi:hypothetical protein
MTDFYKSLKTVNDDEQNRLGMLQQQFNAAIGNGNWTHRRMVGSYMSANLSRQKCYAECPKGAGYDSETAAWVEGVKEDAAGSSATPGEALKDVVSSCKAGCDLKWSGIVQNAARTQGVDGGQTVGRYTGADGNEHDITQCSDLSKYAPKQKMGELCDASEECESNLCVDAYEGIGWCNKPNEPGNTGRCALGMTRVDGGTYGWGNTFNNMCKSNIDQLGLTKWPGVRQFIKYQGVWVELNEGWGYPNAPRIENQRQDNGKYIQDLTTAIKAADAYGDYCKGFINNNEGYILQSAGGENPKPSWTQFSSELGLLNNTEVEGFGGYSSNQTDNKNLDKKQKMIGAWGKMYSAAPKNASLITAKTYSNPTFPIAKMNKAMKQTCPKGMQNVEGQYCQINNSDVQKQGTIGWTGSSYGCNLPTGDDPYDMDCEDLPNKSFTCWHVGSIPKDEEACKTIKGKDFSSCFESGGRPRNVGCPEPAKMIVWIGRPGNAYFATKDSLLPVLQQVATEFPDVRLTTKAEMDDIIAKNLAYCACGWYRTDVFSGTTWKTGNASFSGPGLESIPLTNGFPSNTKSGGGCGGGAQRMIGCGTSPNTWNKGRGGVYLTFSGTLEFAEQKLAGLNFTSSVVESHQQLIAKPPQGPKQIWALSNWTSSGQRAVYRGPKGKGNSILNGGPAEGLGKPWEQMMKSNTYTGDYSTGIKNSIAQLSTGQEEVYGVRGDGRITAHATGPKQLNAIGETGWRGVPGRLTNISASNKDWVFGVNSSGNIYQCKKPCTGSWQKIAGSLKQISGGQNYVYGVNRNNYIYRARLPITNPNNPQWRRIPGRLKWINAGNKNYVYGTNNSNTLYKCTKPCGGDWSIVPWGGGDSIEVDNEYIYGAPSSPYSNNATTHPVDKYPGSWWYYDYNGGKKNFSPELFVGSMGGGKKEGFAPLEGDMITACKKAGTQGGGTVPGVAPTGNFLVENRKKEKAATVKLQSIQKQVNQSIKMLQGDHLNVAGAYKNQSVNLLKQLASYENAKHKLLKSGRELETLTALKEDSHLSKNSMGMGYYLWLTLAISVLGTAIIKIK